MHRIRGFDARELAQIGPARLWTHRMHIILWKQASGSMTTGLLLS
jgi:hypothetical protein